MNREVTFLLVLIMFCTTCLGFIAGMRWRDHHFVGPCVRVFVIEGKKNCVLDTKWGAFIR